MQNLKYAAIILTVLALGSTANGIACTIVSGVDSDEVTWAGNNEDMFFHFDTSIEVLPRSEGRIGAFVVTYNDGFPQGGVNEKGLFFDFNALPQVGIERYRDWDGKSDIPEGLNPIFDMIQRFDNVPDALNYLDQYRWEPMLAAQMHIADARGNLAVFAGDGICWKKRYQVSTNFRVCTGSVEQKLEDNPVGRWRYPIADTTLKSGVTFDSIKATLKNTAQPKMVSTIYSFITNLDTTDTHFYYGADFDNAYTFNVSELVNKGKAKYLMRDIFADAPLVKLYNAYKNGGAESALRYYNSLNTMPAAKRRELLRHLYINLVLDVDPASLDIAAAETVFNEWIKGGGDGTEGLYDGIFSLANGQFDQARMKFIQLANSEGDAESSYVRSIAQRVVDRLDGKDVPDANTHVELEGHKNARFVYVNGLSKAMQFFDFLTPTEEGWAGDFKAMFPDADYQIVVDGKVVATRSEL